MEDFIKSKLKELRGIKADSAYFERSFQAITSQKQSRGIFSVFGAKVVYGVTSAALILAFVFVSMSTTQSPSGPGSMQVASLNEDLEREAPSADFRIHVEEASYFSESAAKVASALDEIVSE